MSTTRSSDYTFIPEMKNNDSEGEYMEHETPDTDKSSRVETDSCPGSDEDDSSGKWSE